MEEDKQGLAILNLWFNGSKDAIIATLPFFMVLTVTDYGPGLRTCKLKVTYSIHTIAGNRSAEYKSGDQAHKIYLLVNPEVIFCIVILWDAHLCTFVRHKLLRDFQHRRFQGIAG